MGDEYTVGDEDGLSPDLAVVRDAIARELYAQLPLRNRTVAQEAIVQEDIPGVAYAVAVLLDRMHLLGDARERATG